MGKDLEIFTYRKNNMPLPFLLIGLTAWQATTAITALALSGYGLNWLSNRAQARRIYTAYVTGGERALRRAIKDEGLADSKEECDALVAEYIDAMDQAESD